MSKESALVQQIMAVMEKNSDMAVCMRQMQDWNQLYIQSAMQALSCDMQEDLADMLKQGRKLRKAIAGMSKTVGEAFAYECGIYNGVYKMLEEINRLNENQQECQNLLNLMERKHVYDILEFLYNNPRARHKSIAENVDIKPNYLSEILQLLRKAGCVEREGRQKDTKYYLTRVGRQTYTTYDSGKVKSEDDIEIVIDFEEIPYKKDFEMVAHASGLEKERFYKSDENFLKGEYGHGDAKWKENYRCDSKFTDQWESMGRVSAG